MLQKPPVDIFPQSQTSTSFLLIDYGGPHARFIPKPLSQDSSILIKMVYDWDGKREICYQMYIQEKKALEEIMDYMKVTYQFAPR